FIVLFFFFSSRRRHTRSYGDWSSDVCSSDLNDMQRLVRTENSMVRWMSGVTLKDRRPSEKLRLGLGIEGVEEVVRRGRLRWFGRSEERRVGKECRCGWTAWQ